MVRRALVVFLACAISSAVCVAAEIATIEEALALIPDALDVVVSYDADGRALLEAAIDVLERELGVTAIFDHTDEDAYLRPNVHYKVDDHWSAEIGGNVFVGAEDHTFFGQFEKNSNVYLAARYSF